MLVSNSRCSSHGNDCGAELCVIKGCDGSTQPRLKSDDAVTLIAAMLLTRLCVL
jgi:hypothetical protein